MIVFEWSSIAAFVRDILPGAIGSAISLRVLPEQSTRMGKVWAFGAGLSISYYTGSYVAAQTGAPVALSYFVCGFFGLLVFSTVAERLKENPLILGMGLASKPQNQEIKSDSKGSR